MGDLNAISPADLSPFEENNYPFSTQAIARLVSFGLVDSLDLARGDEPASPTFPTPFPTYLGTDIPAKRIDYIFVSADLAPRVRAAWVDTSSATDLLSDHRPVLAVLDPAGALPDAGHHRLGPVRPGRPSQGKMRLLEQLRTLRFDEDEEAGEPAAGEEDDPG